MHLKIGVDSPEKTNNYEVIDLDNNTRIPCVQEANDETGEFSLHLRDENGVLIYDSEKKNDVLFKFKGNIKLIKKENIGEKK